jgi:hypothetical protein
MLLRKRPSGVLLIHAAMVVAVLSTCLALRVSMTCELSPYVPGALPQLALGDFDGDGHVDTAAIRDDIGGTHISIKFSGSLSTVDLRAAVTAVVQGDVDDDGDLDLVAATPSGELLIWINDGHGQFTQEPRLPLSGLSGAPVITEVAAGAVAIESRAPLQGAPDLYQISTTATAAARCDPSIAVTNGAAGLSSLRAPPRIVA